MPLPPCPPDDPSAAMPLPPGAALGRSTGHAFVQIMDEGPCFRRAGCLSFGLPVLSAEGVFIDIERYQEGHAVRACGRDLAWSDRALAFCDGLPEAARHPYGIIVAFLDTAVVVSADHIFMLADGSLCRADRLTPEDALMGADAHPAEIAALYAGDYLAGFFRIATAVEQPPETLDGHLLNTNGVVSGDYAVQVFARTGALAALFHADRASAPAIGAPGYVERHGAACLQEPDLAGLHLRVYGDPPRRG